MRPVVWVLKHGDRKWWYRQKRRRVVVDVVVVVGVQMMGSIIFQGPGIQKVLKMHPGVSEGRRGIFPVPPFK